MHPVSINSGHSTEGHIKESVRSLGQWVCNAYEPADSLWHPSGPHETRHAQETKQSQGHLRRQSLREQLELLADAKRKESEPDKYACLSIPSSLLPYSSHFLCLVIQSVKQTVMNSWPVDRATGNKIEKKSPYERLGT
eukprot:scaffold150107_cov19-Prasinocladus_malaysianus.AAC.1